MSILETDAHSIGLPLSTERSAQLFERARRALAGGVSSSARLTGTDLQPHPLYITHGKGSRIWDADGNEFVDYLLSHGCVILGHADEQWIEAIQSQLQLGTMFGVCNLVEVELAEQIQRMVPCAELIRFSNSGSEAICGAIRAARGYTGKTKILKFEGHYHGWVDVLAVSNRPSKEQAGPINHPNSHAHSAGIPAGVVNDVVICPWNDPQTLRDILDAHDGEFAAMIAEPIVANNSCIMPAPGYLEFLREQCDRRGIVLIFDEIVTGFRIAPGGAQEYFGVHPDLAVYSKALGGGLPISAFAGTKKVMAGIAANTVKHGGTYNGNPLSAMGSLHTLRTLERTDIIAALQAGGEQIMEAIRKHSFDCRIPCVVQGVGSMFQVIFGSFAKPIRQYRDLFEADKARYTAFQHALLEQNIHVNAAGMACWFISGAHTSDDVAQTVEAVGAAMKAIA